MSAQFDTADLLLVPLTPVHVGGGEESTLRPESYRIAGDRLETFAVRDVLSRLPGEESRRLADALVRDPLGGLERVRQKLPPDAILQSIRLGPQSRGAVQQAMETRPGRADGRRGDVELFVRSAGRPFLPGSTLKGALRTAWLAHCVERYGVAAPQGPRHDRSDRLQAAAFALDASRATDADPMRDVTVSDGAMPQGATRIDQVWTWKRGAGAHAGEWGFGTVGQMHWERLACVGDGGVPPLIRLSVGVRSAAVREERRRLGEGVAPRRAPASVAALLAALEAHHAPLWRREAEETFFAGPSGARLRESLGLFAWLARGGSDPDAALVRLGRAGHAESKSVAPFREVELRAPRGGGTRTAAEGTTRHVLRFGSTPLPFGWAMLVRADRWREPRGWLPPLTETEERPPAPAGGTTPRTQVLFRRGDTVVYNGEEAVLTEDARAGMAKVTVRFEDGEEEEVPVRELRRG